MWPCSLLCVVSSISQPSIYVLGWITCLFGGTCPVHLEEAMAPHSGTLAWKIPWTEEPGRSRLRSDVTERLHFHLPLSCVGEGNGNPLLCSCLENPRDGGVAWWAAVYGVAQSRTQLKRLSSSSSHVNNVKSSDQWAQDSLYLGSQRVRHD